MAHGLSADLVHKWRRLAGKSLGKDLHWVFELKSDVSYDVYVFGWPLAQALVFAATAFGFLWSQMGFFAATMLILRPLG